MKKKTVMAFVLTAVAEFDEATGFRMLIPDTDSFQHGAINASQADIAGAEKKQG